MLPKAAPGVQFSKNACAFTGKWKRLDFPLCGQYPANVPGTRNEAVSWIDSNDKLWLFGGDGLDSVTSFGGGSLNDLWKCVHR